MNAELKNFYNEKGEVLMRNILNVEKIEKYYGNKDNVTKAIDNISFKVDEGEFVGIMGPSGSGKTHYLTVYQLLIMLLREK